MMKSFAADVQKAADEVLPVPFDQSYWVVPVKLLAGAYPGDLIAGMAENKLGPIIDAGIRCFIDLTHPGDLNMFGQYLNPYQDLLGKIAAGHFKIIYRQMPIADLDIPSKSGMVEILDVIDGCLLSDIPVYLHCLGGLGRTGTVVGCWLARHGIAQGQEIIDLIFRLRRNEADAHRPSPQTARQCRFVYEWKQGE